MKFSTTTLALFAATLVSAVPVADNTDAALVQRVRYQPNTPEVDIDK